MSRFHQVSEPKPMHLQVADSIRTAILRGDLKVGERLPLEELGKELGVSRMPVREALIRLEKEGLIVFQNRRGAEVAGITVEQIEEITHLRSLLEADALKRAFVYFQVSDFANARAILEDAKNADDPDELADLHWQFHHCLYTPCGRPMQVEMIDMLHANVDRFFRIEWREAGLREGWVKDHEAIIEALEASNIDAALELIESHLRMAAERVAGTLQD